MIGSLVLAHLWQSSLVLLLIFALASTMRRAPARLLHLLWLAALCKLLLPLPLLGPIGGALLHAGGEATGSLAAGRAGIAALLAPEILVVRAETAGAALASPAMWAVLWLCGAAAIAAIWLRSSLRARPGFAPGGAAVPPIPAQLAGLLEQANIPRDRLRVSASDTGPCVVGLFRPRIVLPACIVDRLERAELRAILLHEDAHRRRRDPLFGLIQRVAILGFYYYPLLWPVLHRLKAATEMACDEHVLSQGVSRETYARALARTVQLRLGPAASLAAEGHSRSVLEARFQRIREYGRYAAMRRYSVLLAAAICAVAVTSFFPIAPLASAGPLAALAPGGSGDLQFVELNRLRERDLRLTMTFERTSAARVLAALCGAAGTELRFDGPAPAMLVDLDFEATSFKGALELLSQSTGIGYRVTDPGTLVAFTPGVVTNPTAQPQRAAPYTNGPPLLAGQDGVSLPRRLDESLVQPVYPEEARKEKITGRVILQAIIDADGSIRNVEVLNSDKPGVGFEQAAIDAVEQWRYEPATLDGKPVAVYFTIRIDFKLQ